MRLAAFVFAWLVVAAAALAPPPALAVPDVLDAPDVSGAGTAAPAPGARRVAVGVLVAPPFVEKDGQGNFHGVAMDLWRDVALDMGLTWQAVEYDLDGLLAAVQSGAVAAGISALSITPERESTMDFSQPYYYTGLGIAVAAKDRANIADTVLRAVFSPRLLLSILSLLGLLLLVGTIVWALEHRRNPGHFRPGHKGLGDGLWWSAVTMTSVGYGDATPKTLAGRAVALVWMFASVALLASFTAGITSSLTVESMGGLVRDAEDLHKVRTGVVRDSSAEEELVAGHVGVLPFASAEEGLRALLGGEIDAFVHDQPLLHYYRHHAFMGKIRVLSAFFDPQIYGFAFPRGSDLRKAVNVAMLRRLEDHDYRIRLFGPYLGRAAAR
uniref:Periplasmic component of amino acid ABC-type transporter/signal transduction system n=1 Tax=Desulfovibrio sp. U5L TaxID=596152 RepID=I2Q230_9BACT